MRLIRTLAAATGCAATLLATVPAHAALTVLDDFNRPDAATLGANWTQQAGSCTVVSNEAVCSGNAIATWNGPTSSTAAFDLRTTNANIDYVAIVLGYAADNNNLFIKVQDQNDTAGIDTIGFYFGKNGANNGAWGGSTFVAGVLPDITAARMTVMLTGSTVSLDIDSNFDDIADFSFSAGGAPQGLLGTGFGIGGFSGTNLRLDNFAVPGASNVPTPGTLTLVAAAMLGVALVRRRKIA